jgi:hypothetical protein
MPHSIFELRQYTLQPGKRDTLVDLFDRLFIEPQEAAGMAVWGQFRDLDEPDRFVWLRSFEDMRARKEALTVFYGGAVWKAHKAAANATMIDSDNVLLLRPARAGSGFTAEQASRPPIESATPSGAILACIHSFSRPVDDGAVSSFEHDIAPTVSRAGGRMCGYFVTEESSNDYPALPVRDGENVFVWLAAFPSVAAIDALGPDSWRSAKDFAGGRGASLAVRKLAPTTRSLLR